MWIVAKINKKNQSLFFNEFKKKINDLKIYYPKIFHEKKK